MHRKTRSFALRVGLVRCTATRWVRQGLPAKHTELRWFVRHHAGTDQATVHVHLDPPAEGFEIATVDLPDGVADLTAGERAGLVVEVIHAGLAGLHSARG